MTPKVLLAAGAVIAAEASYLLATVPEVNASATTVILAIINKAPEILMAGGMFVTALVGWKNLKVSKAAAVAATEAAVKVEEVRVAADTAAVKVEEVRATTEKSAAETAKAMDAQSLKLATIEATGDRTHTLVNSNMGAQLKISAVALRRVADLTKDEEDASIAKAAEDLLDEHVAKQAKVDAKDAKA